MGFKTTSFISIANRGLNPTISSSLTRRVVNPVWSFNRTVVVTFTSSGSWVCPANVTSVEYLVVAGGGGGGGETGGGGGAGGFRTGTGYAVTAGNTYTVTVGAGGSGGSGASSSNQGGDGTNSVFDTITSAGGGGGGNGAVNGRNGGSGGGGGGYTAFTTAGGSGNTPSVSPSVFIAR